MTAIHQFVVTHSDAPTKVLVALATSTKAYDARFELQGLGYTCSEVTMKTYDTSVEQVIHDVKRMLPLGKPARSPAGHIVPLGIGQKDGGTV